MSCPEYLVSELGRHGVGVIQPQSGLDYPFVAPSEDIRYLVADMHVAVDDAAWQGGADRPTKFTPPFYVKNLYGIGCVENTPAAGFLAPVNAADIVICDATGAVVFSSVLTQTSFDSRAWGTNYRLYSWRNSAGTCSVLAYTSWAETDGEKRNYNKYLKPENGVLDARVVYVIPRRLLSIRVGTQESAPVVKGNVVFRNGYNTEIVAGSETVTNFIANTPVTISATAGSGAGKYSTCGDDLEPVVQPIKRINGVSVESGDFLLSAADCLYVRRPTKKIDGVVSPDDYFSDGNQLQRPLAIGAVCDACCKCNDYVDLALKINKYQSQYANIGVRVNETKQIHEQNIQKWIDERNCGLETTLRVLLVAQRCPYMDIVLMICNPCQDCLYSKELQLELEPAAGVMSYAEVMTGYTALFAANVNGRPVPITRSVSGRKTLLSVQFPTVKNGDSAYVRFRVKFSNKSEYAVTGTLTGILLDDTPILAGCVTEDGPTRLPAEATATQALYCDANGETNLP
jgi:hypothetical protein